MKVAVLADAHANMPALEAVCRDLDRQKVDEVWYLGDFLGYGPSPREVVQKLKKRTTHSIVGNYDLNVLKFPKKKDKWKAKKDPDKYFSFRWTYRHCSAALKKYIQNLPQTLRVKKQGITFLLVHGSPEKIDEPLTRKTPRCRFSELARTVRADVVLCGHTHDFFDKRIGKIRFINPGSVGRPFDADPRASYAILAWEGPTPRVYNRRIPYPVNRTLRKMKQEKFPARMIASIKAGKSLDDIPKEEKTRK